MIQTLVYIFSPGAGTLPEHALAVQRPGQDTRILPDFRQAAINHDGRVKKTAPGS